MMAGPKQRQVALAGGGYTDISATIPAHYAILWEDGELAATAFEYKLPNDSFVTVYTSKAGRPIKLFGDGVYGVLGLPANWNPRRASADVIIQIQAVGGGPAVLNVIESESEVTPAELG